ncbi:MAG: hypothetical protein IH892_08700, partial [Planctomycetes bacterium]|nr:hypothetical protein [Planctomycetota bacterium]
MIARSKIAGARLGRNSWRGLFHVISLVFLFGSAAGIIYADIESDLIGYWPLDGDATDASGNGFDATVVGNGEWVTGMFGDGIQLDGSSRVEIADFSLTTDAITFSAWINGWKVADWGGIVSSRFPTATEMIFGNNDTLHYVWNNNSNQTWCWSGG